MGVSHKNLPCEKIIKETKKRFNCPHLNFNCSRLIGLKPETTLEEVECILAKCPLIEQKSDHHE